MKTVRTTCLLAVALLFVQICLPLAGQVTDSSAMKKASLRQGGAADLNAWSRPAIGTAGGFTNPGTEDWIPYVPSASDVHAGGILDASHYIESPGGTHGFLQQDNRGNFIFEDGTPATFLGGQISPFPEKEEAEWIVQWMRRHGLNYARSHGFGLPDQDRWEKLDYLVHQCKQAGIYLVLTPVYWTEFEVTDPEGNPVKTSSHVILFFNREMEMAVRDLWKAFYTHKNPYTGLRYMEDPTIVSFELKNEDSPFWALDWIRKGLPVYWKEMQQQFSDFLKDKYGTTGALREAWTLEGHGTALEESESLEEGNVDLYEMSGWEEEKSERDMAMRPRKSDQTAFLHQKLTSFYARSYAYLREIGCKQAICGSNWRGHSYSMRHVLEADSHMDYMDQHDYFDHPQGGWRTQDAVQHNQSMLKSAQGGLIGNLAPRQVINRPYTVSEWNIGSWNEHLMEASFSMISVGLLQGWDGLIQFVLLPGHLPGEKPVLGNNFFNVSNNPSVVLQYPTLARMWHRKDIAEAEPVFIRRISPAQLNMPGPVSSKYYPEAFILTHRDRSPGKDEYGHMLAVVGKVGNEFVQEFQPHYEADGIEGYLDQEGKTARSMTGELTWDWGQGFLVVDTDRTQGVCGYIGNSSLDLADITVRSNTAYGLVMLTTVVDDLPIRSSSRLLLTALGRARNTGTVYGNAADRDKTSDRYASSVSLPPGQRVAVLALGEAPIISEPVKGEIRITMDRPEAAVVYVLDHTGRRGAQVPATVSGGKLVLQLPGNHGACFFEITGQDSQTTSFEPGPF
ncbi:MAG: beta-galactosidase [Bacteroidota bacterium]